MSSCRCVLNKLFNKDNCPKHFMNELKQTIKHRNRLKYLPEGRAMFVQPSQYMNVQIKVPIISFPAECQCWQWMSSLNEWLETSPPPELPSMSISRKSFTSIYTVGARVSSTFMGQRQIVKSALCLFSPLASSPATHSPVIDWNPLCSAEHFHC